MISTVETHCKRVSHYFHFTHLTLKYIPTPDYFSQSKTVLYKRNIMQVTYIIKNFSSSHIEESKRETEEANFNNMFYLN